MGPQEEGVTHPATSLGVTSVEFPRISEEALLALGQSRTNDPRETHMRMEKVVRQTGFTRTREELSPATRTGGKFQSLEQQT